MGNMEVRECLQLHRIIAMQKYTAIDDANNSWASSTTTTAFQTSYTYDPNGNLLNLTRNDATNAIDNIGYNYIDPMSGEETNRLLWVTDTEGTTGGGGE